jgi:hypothetical protein
MTITEAEQLLADIPEYGWIVEATKQFWSSGDIAKHLSINAGTVRRWCEEGLLPGAVFYGEKLGWRIPRSGILLYLASLRSSTQ